MQSYKRIYKEMIIEGTDKFDIGLYINGDY